MSIYDHEVETIDGETLRLGEFRGRPMLIVNVASQCGYTPQYRGLQRLWERYRDRGLAVLGFPANDFGHQEPGTDREIAEFARRTYDADFPLFAKLHVTGEKEHPLFKELREASGEDVTWNFNKYLIDRDGQIVAHFSSAVEPTSDRLTEAIEQVL